MNSLDLIVTALLVEGAIAQTLQRRVQEKYAKHSALLFTLQQAVQSPTSTAWQAALREELSKAGVDGDAEIVQLAQHAARKAHGGDVYHAEVRGSGTVVQGKGNVVAGKGGVAVGGNVSGPIITGGQNVVGQQDALAPQPLHAQRPTSNLQLPTWLDVEIRLGRRDEHGYPVEITAGGQQEFAPGYAAGDLDAWSASGDALIDGRDLFQRLLVDGALQQAWAEARGRSAKRRIRLRIDPAAPELHLLPWELLRDGSTWLATSGDTPFSRYLPMPIAWPEPIAQRPLRVLVAISNPIDLQQKYDLPAVDMALEEGTLRAAFADMRTDRVQAEFLPPPITVERLGKRLLAGRHHVLHFLGHGGFNEKKDKAALYLQNDDGTAQRATDDQLAGLLTMPHLIFLAACQSAKRSTRDAWVGLAPRLVAAGVPAVLAMQNLVSMISARQFSEVFYQQVLDHGVVDAACNEARSILTATGRPDAAVPALFMRLPAGQLWTIEK